MEEPSDHQASKTAEFNDPATIVDRLRGIYRIPIRDGLGATGGGDEPDNLNEFVRSFQTVPIQHEAAREIERLRADNERLRAALEVVQSEILLDGQIAEIVEDALS